jgi:hypothetical protein
MPARVSNFPEVAGCSRLPTNYLLMRWAQENAKNTITAPAVDAQSTPRYFDPTGIYYLWHSSLCSVFQCNLHHLTIKVGVIVDQEFRNLRAMLLIRTRNKKFMKDHAIHRNLTNHRR